MKVIFETERLIMRELTLEDTKEIYEYSIEESMKTGIPNQVYESMEEARGVIEFLSSKYAEDLKGFQYPYVLGVEIKETKQLIGHVGLSEIDEGIEVGYAIGEAYQGKGYAPEALTGLVNWAKENLKLSILYGVVRSENIPSCKVLEKAHFQFKREEERKTSGENKQWKIYSI